MSYSYSAGSVGSSGNPRKPSETLRKPLGNPSGNPPETPRIAMENISKNKNNMHSTARKKRKEHCLKIDDLGKNLGNGPGAM